MKYRLLKFLQSINWILRVANNIVASRIITSEQLTPEHLKSWGWIQEGNFWVEANIKTRDKIWIQFENHYYRVYHGEERTFISLKATIGWFQNYYRLLSPDALYAMAGV